MDNRETEIEEKENPAGQDAGGAATAPESAAENIVAESDNTTDAVVATAPEGAAENAATSGNVGDAESREETAETACGEAAPAENVAAGEGSTAAAGDGAAGSATGGTETAGDGNGTPRRKGRKIFLAVALILFALVIAAPWILMLTVGDLAADSSGGGLEEKRELAEFPTTFSNNYFERFEKFFTDHAPVRNRLIAYEKDFSQQYETFYRMKIMPKLTALLIKPSNPGTPGSPSLPSESLPSAPPDADGHRYQVIRTQQASEERYGYTLSVCTDCGKYNLEITEAKHPDTSYLAPQSAGGAIYGRYDWLFYEGDNSIGYYQGTNLLSDREMRSIVHTFERLQDCCDKKGIRLVIMAAPNKEQVYPEYMPSYPVDQTEKRQDRFLQYVRENSSIRYLYPLAQLNEAKYLYDVFYKQDTHWNKIGGFVGAMEVYRALGMETTELYALSVTETTRDGGDLSNFCGYHTVYTDYEVNYKPEITVTADHLEGSRVGSTELVRYTSSSPNRAKLVVLGDSFRHSMEPYLSKDFSEAIIAHRDDFSHAAVQDALKNLSEGDVLLLLAVERYDASNTAIAGALIPLLQ